MAIKQYGYLKRLSEVNGNQGVKFSSYAAAPGSHCPMHTSLAALRAVKGVSTLVVGMEECGYYSRYVMTSPRGQNGAFHYVYVLDASEVVFGCRKGLKAAIQEMEEEGARIIVLVMTCIPSLIGEDMKAVAWELRDSVRAKILYIDAAHFKRNGYQSGPGMVYEALFDLLPDRASGNKGIPSDQLSVNFMGDAVGKDAERLKEALLSHNVSVNEYGSSFNPEYISRAGEAAVSVVWSQSMEKAAQKTEKIFGIPCISVYNLYDGADITQAYRRICEAAQIPMPEEFLREEEALKEMEQNDASCFENRRFVSTSPDINILPFSAYLCRLGMLPVLLHIEEFHEGDLQWKEAILLGDRNPYVTYISDKNRIYELIEQENVTLSFGMCQGLEEKYVIGSDDIRKAGRFCGYQRTRMLLELMREVFKERKESYGTL